MPGLFGTSGIRGDAEKLFTNQFCFDLGRSFVKFLDRHGARGAIAVGMDPRGSSPRIKGAFCAGLAYGGREIYDEGAAPVPSMCYLMQISDFITASAMVTGSHIKAYLNGIKFFAFNEEISDVQAAEIERIYKLLKGKVRYRAIKGGVEIENRAAEEYKAMLLGLAKKPYPRWKIVADPGDGAQSDIMPQVLRECGCEVTELNSTIQGQFFARDTENEPDFAELKEKVKETGADFGIGWDSDGDRAIFIGKGGVFIPGDYTAGLIAKYASGKSIVTPIATSQVVDYLGKKVLRTKVGSPSVIAGMKKSGAKFGFEANGGGVSAEIMYTRDGGSTTIKLLNILAATKKSLEEALAILPKFYLVKTKLDYKWEQKEEILKKAKAKYKGKKMEEMDGLKIWVDEKTWMLFRSSLNAPEFRIFAESDEQVKAERLLKEGRDLVWQIVS